MISGNVGVDQLSEDPPWEPLVDSWLHPGSTKEDASSEIDKVGDLIAGIRLSDTCRKSWRPGDWQGHLDGVELAGRRWLWEDKGGDDKDETEGAEGDNFTGDGQETAGDAVDSLT